MNTTIEDWKYIRERKAIALEKSNRHAMTADQVAAQVKAFLAKGGRITKVPRGQSGLKQNQTIAVTNNTVITYAEKKENANQAGK